MLHSFSKHITLDVDDNTVLQFHTRIFYNSTEYHHKVFKKQYATLEMKK